jgi:hypothetical protein
MSAAEVIALIKKLPPEERAEVSAFLQKEGVAACVEEAVEEKKVRYASNDEFEKVLPRVFEKHRELFRRLAQ